MNTLNEWALRYGDATADLGIVANIAVMAFGALVAWVLVRRPYRLLRAPYFALVGGITLSVAGVGYGNATQLVGAIASGLFFVSVLVEIGYLLCAGFALMVVGMARARDAYDKPWAGFLAFIPIGNLFLLMTPSLDADLPPPSRSGVDRAGAPSLRRSGGRKRGVTAALVGVGLFGLVAGRALTNYTDVELALWIERAEQAGVFAAQQREMAFQQVIDITPFPADLDGDVRLIEISIDGPLLRYEYEIISDRSLADFTNGRGPGEFECLEPFFEALLAGGAVFEHVYTRATTQESGTVRVTQQSCAI